MEKDRTKQISFTFILTAAFILVASISYAQDRLGTLAIKTVRPAVNTEALDEWKKDFFEIDEIWVLEDKEFFFDSLRASGLSHEMYEQLANSVRADISGYEFVRVRQFYYLERSQEFLFLPAEIKNRLPARVLQTAYALLLQANYAPSSSTFNSVDEATAFFRRFGLRDQALDKVLSRVFKINGTYYFFYTPDIWSNLSDELKLKIINEYTDDQNARRGLQVDLTFTSTDDIVGIADRYSGERDPRILERYLRLLLARSQRGSVTTPLSKILHPFIRKNINTHASCTGPNCFNSGVSVNEGNAYEQRHVGSEEDFLDIVFRKYRFVRSSEKLNPGDLFIYRESNGKLVHASTYITDNIVYTKNGASKLNPYLFQSRSQNESIYFPDGKYKLMVLRISKQGESAASKYGFHNFFGREVYFTDTTTPGRSTLGPPQIKEDPRKQPSHSGPGPRNRCTGILSKAS